MAAAADRVVEFRLLGPVQVLIGDEQLALRGKHRSLLAMLLLNADHAVSVDRVVHGLWAGTSPGNAAGRVRTLVAELRRLCAACGELIVTRPSGYLLRMDSHQLDLDRFTEFAEQARQVVASQPKLAVARYDDALALWRGAALGGASGPFVEAQAIRLEDARLRVVKERADALLGLGRQTQVIDELSQLVVEHPLQERPHAQLMTALYRDGRRAEALKIYRMLRSRLAAELGVDPTPALQLLHHQILTGDPALDRSPSGTSRPPGRPTVNQLPAAASPFVARGAELAQLGAYAAAGNRLLLVVGAAGSGKTALVVRWAHRMAPRFPDGQLFISLRGFDRGPRTQPMEILPRLLQTVGVAAPDIPIDLDGQVALYRSVLSDRRILLVLDDAADPEQVRPLLPGEAGCVVVVTSRDRLGGLVALDGARRIRLDALPPPDAVEVLAQIVGSELIDADRTAAAELAGLCGRLPLALRIAGGRLVDRPHADLRRYVDELAQRGRLAGLQVAGDNQATVRGAFELSYRALPPAARRAFRLLGLVPAPAGLSAAAGAALAGAPLVDVEPLLDMLDRVHLVQACSADRYACHDLLLDYATELAEAEDAPADRVAAVRRLLQYYLVGVDAAGTLLGLPSATLPREPVDPAVPPVVFADADHAHRWLLQEWDNLVAAQQNAACAGYPSMTWHLADAVRVHMYYLIPSQSRLLAMAELGLVTARQCGDLAGEAAMRNLRGLLRLVAADNLLAVTDYDRAAELYRQTGLRHGESAAMRGAGVSLAELGRLHAATERFTTALALDRSLGDHRGMAANHINLSMANLDSGDLDQSCRHLVRALVLARRHECRLSEAVALGNLGALYRHQGRFDEAHAALTGSLVISKAVAARQEESNALTIFGRLYRDQGDYQCAVEAISTAAEIAEQIRDARRLAIADTVLASLDLRLGRPIDAVERLTAVLRVPQHTRHRQNHIESLVTLARAYSALGRHRLAHDHARLAMTLARVSGSPLAVASAHTALATAALGQSDADAAVTHAEAALEPQRRSGQRLAQARTLYLLGQAQEQAGRIDLAQTCWHQAHLLFTEFGAVDAEYTAAALAKAVVSR